MGDYGLKIAKEGYDVATAANKDLAFSSELACLKILQFGKVSAVSPSQITFSDIVSFPVVLLVFLYNSATSEYEPVEAEFNSTTLYLDGGEAANSNYYYFICYG